MPERVTPMIHVPDVRATIDWYKTIGFEVLARYGDDGDGLSFGIVSFGTTQVMFNQGGKPSDAWRREVDLYVYSDNVEKMFEQIHDRVEIVEGLHDTFYGMREFIIRDVNRFWITFGQESGFGSLMNAIREGQIELAESALKRGGISAGQLTTAWVLASTGDTKNEAIQRLLGEFGVIAPPAIAKSALKSHVGHYKNEKGMLVEERLVDDTLFAVPRNQDPICLIGLNETTFRPTDFDAASVRFEVADGKTIAFELTHGNQMTRLDRVSEDL